MKRESPAMRGAFLSKGSDMKPAAVPNLGYRLTTAEILYHLPDHPHLLQSFVWQQMDVAPDFPALHGFLNFWRRGIAGRLHSVTVVQTPLLASGGWRHASISLQLH
jgi:uncharacterized protein Usg